MTSSGNFKKYIHSPKNKSLGCTTSQGEALHLTWLGAFSVSFPFNTTPAATPYSSLRARDYEKHLTNILFNYHVVPGGSITTHVSQTRSQAQGREKAELESKSAQVRGPLKSEQMWQGWLTARTRCAHPGECHLWLWKGTPSVGHHRGTKTKAP